METYQNIKAEGRFPLSASDMALAKYLAPGTLGKVEEEEAAVRLLLVSKAQGEFVGTPANYLLQTAFDELIEYQQIISGVAWLQEEESYWKKRERAYWRLAIFTLGIACLFVRKPVQPDYLPVKQEITAGVLSPILESGMKGDQGLQDLMDAFWSLVEKGLVEKKDVNEIDYFFPTPKLVELVCR